MNQFKDQKEMRMAINGRMGLIGGGIILLLTALTSTLLYGMNMFIIVSKVSKSDAEYIEMLETSNLDINLVRVLAVCFIILAVVEIFAGVFSLRLCNRLDKCLLMRKITIVLIVFEVLMQILLIMTGMLNFGMLIISLLVPLYILWSVTRLCKLAKEYPDRTYVIDKQKTPAAAPRQTPKKSLHERAMMPASLSGQEKTSEETSQETAEETTEETAEEKSIPENTED